MWEVNMEKIDLLITLTAHENDANNVIIAFTMGMNARSLVGKHFRGLPIQALVSCVVIGGF